MSETKERHKRDRDTTLNIPSTTPTTTPSTLHVLTSHWDAAIKRKTSAFLHLFRRFPKSLLSRRLLHTIVCESSCFSRTPLSSSKILVFFPALARPAFTAFPPCSDNRLILSHAIIMIIDLSSLQSAESRTRALRPPTTLCCWGSCHQLRSALGFAKHRSASSPCRGFAYGCRPSIGSGYRALVCCVRYD